jgi:FkbM family methyltransferase
MRTVFPHSVEDELKAEFFAKSPAGFFVEVGANEPRHGSQTWQFEQAGWNGVLVEPQPELAERLRAARRARIVAAACSSPANAGGKMTLFLSGPHSSLKRDLAVTGVVPHGTIEVPARTLDDILIEAGAPTPIDFISIDVEGHEVDVLSGFDVERWRPRLILVEDHVSSLATHRFLTRAGYRLIRRTGLNGWYVPRSQAPRVGLGWWQIARKYYLALPFRVLRDRKRRWRDRLRQRLGLGARRRYSLAARAELISIIVTTYNRDDALEAALRALSRQSDRNFEIIVAEDGSRPETARVVERWASRLPVPLKHVWQQHDGFRGGEIRNRGIRASAGTYCIFLDGDCLSRPDFVATHRALAQPGWFVTGNRTLLSREFTAALLAEGTAVETWSLGTLMRERLRGGVNRLLPAVRLPLGPLRNLPRGWKGVQSCNLAVAREDLDRIDGFDAAYTGWGREDSDLVVRLQHGGVRRKDGRFATGVLHLWHVQNDRSQLPVNEARLAAAIRSDRVRALKGLSFLGDDAETREPATLLRQGG